MGYEHYGKLSYHEWAHTRPYSITGGELLNTTTEELLQFKNGLIEERKYFLDESEENHEEIFWAVMDELGIATKITI